MRQLVVLTLLLLAFGCKKNEDYNDDTKDKRIRSKFSYVNPQGKTLPDSTLILPTYGFAINVDSPYKTYGGANFVNETHWETKSGQKLNTMQGIFLQWKLLNLANDKWVRTDTTEDLKLQIFDPGKYKLFQYVYSSAENRKNSMYPLDSISKSIEFVNVKQIDSITVDTLSFHSPYLNWELDRDAPVDAFVSVYSSNTDMENGEEPIFTSETIKGLRQGTTGIKFNLSGLDHFIPTFMTTRGTEDGALLQLNVQQGGKTYTLIDNDWRLIFRYLQTGYLSEDKSSVMEELKIRFGNMTLKVNSSFKFSQ
ncbi:hypothetical protein [Sphingobacterium haloxyli]|uniref:Uncharacterized protein n=1 Tax=Sphingobacterium haloxyli TaxID=2100533 RepID=A0A2S9J6V4_9SPHI|nr:hypothetical protein [Sphingobacterium haloxyli]PRD48523.1 hypothetical protein C5745_04800 [Sphingobacterium haloxyli]